MSEVPLYDYLDAEDRRQEELAARARQHPTL